MVDHVSNNFLKEVWVPIDQVEVVPTIAPDVTLNDMEAKAEPVQMIDLYNAIRYSLYHEVLTHQVLNETQIEALHDYFKVLHKYFPFDNENPRRFIKRMSQWMAIRKNETNTMNIEAIMRAGSEGFLPPMQPYVGCKGSSPELRGYPCARPLAIVPYVDHKWVHEAEDEWLLESASGATGYERIHRQFFYLQVLSRSLQRDDPKLGEWVAPSQQLSPMVVESAQCS